MGSSTPGTVLPGPREGSGSRAFAGARSRRRDPPTVAWNAGVASASLGNYLEFKMIDADQKPAASYGEAADTALKLFVVLSRAHRTLAEHARRDQERHGLGATEFAVLEALYHKGALLVGEVGARILLTSGSTTYVIDKLEQRGLVRRRPCESDRRALYVDLTREGRALIRKIFPDHARAIASAVAGLTLEEQRTVTRLLKKLGKSAQEAL